VQEQGAYVGCSKQRITVKKSNEELASVRLQDVSQLVLLGNVQVSTQAVQVLCEASIPVVYLSTGHWFYGISQGLGLRNSYDRAAQFRIAGEAETCLKFARQIVTDKAENQRTLLRRNAPADQNTERAVRDIDYLIERLPSADSLETLLGMEGAIAAAYFAKFSTLLKPRDFDAQWDFNGRNRRPPRDPVNALLSFGYAMLAKDCAVALLAEGLDPWWGLYHQPRHGRAALALDIMEPFRPAIVDSAVISAINTGMVQQSSFENGSNGCILKPDGRKAFIRAYDARLDQLITHPIFDYRCSWRVVIRLQARLLSRWFRGELPLYTSVTTR
jgi:CRISP-associated protein Cas1